MTQDNSPLGDMAGVPSKPVNDGGPAFPLLGNEYLHPWDGMSLRDWFAGQIVAQRSTGLTIFHNGGDPLEESEYQGKLVALEVDFAYKVADSMIARRGQ